jgi:hypothetical protein
MNIGAKDLRHKVRVSTLMHRAYAHYARERLVDESGTIISECFPLDEAHSVPKGCAVEKTRVKPCVENVASPPGPCELTTESGNMNAHECPAAVWELSVTGVYRCPRAMDTCDVLTTSMHVQVSIGSEMAIWTSSD